MARYLVAATLAALLLGALLRLNADEVRGQAPDEVVLEDVRYRLFPEADPKAEWIFAADRVRYNPQTQSATIEGIRDGKRLVRGKLDLTLKATSVRVDRWDNLQMDEAWVFLPEACWEIHLERTPGKPVQIVQRRGFIAPRFTLKGPGIEVEGQGFQSDFALKNASWRSGKEVWTSGEENTCPR